MSSPSPLLSNLPQFTLTLWRSKWLRLSVMLLVALWLVNLLVACLTDAQWFGASGYSLLWQQKLVTHLTLFCVTFAGTCLLLACPVRALTSLKSVPLEAPAEYQKLLLYARCYQLYARRWAWSSVAVIAFAAGLVLASHWREFLLFRHGSTVSVRDAFYGHDAGFYIFRLPFVQALLSIGWYVVSVSLLLIGVLTIGHAAIALLSKRSDSLSFSTIWLLRFGVIWFLLRAAGYYLAGFALLTAQHTNEVVPAGMTYLDWNVRRPILWMGIVFCVSTSLLLLMAKRLSRCKGRRSLVASGILSLLGPAMIMGLATVIFHWLIVAPDEYKAETHFRAAHLEATRAAWQLDEVIGRDVTISPLRSTSPSLTQKALQSTPVWEEKELSEAANSSKSLSQDSMLSLTLDRYEIKGQLKLVAVAANAVQPETLSQSWVNRHVSPQYHQTPNIVFYDPVRSTPGGEPATIALRGFGIAQQLKEDKSIWYGAMAQDYLLVPGSVPGTVVLDTLWRRVLWAWRLKDINLFLHSSRKSGATSLIIYRSIQERAARFAPFLQPAGEPYPVIVSGRIMWMLDLMTVTSHYPGALSRDVVEEPRSSGSEPYNAACDSVKMVMDSADGRVTFFVAGKRVANEPILQAWQRVLPGLIRPLAEMPVDLQEHRRYPRSLFIAKAQLLARYGSGAPQEFYGRQRQWAADTNGESRVADAAQYLLAPSKQGSTPASRFVLQMPLITQQGSIAALLQAGCDKDDYGRLRLLRMKNVSFDRSTAESLKRAVPPPKPSANVALKAGTLVPQIVQVNESVAHLVLFQSFYQTAKQERRFMMPTESDTAVSRFWRVGAADAAGEMFGVGSNIEEALAQLKRKAVNNGATRDADLTPAQQALRAHDAAQAATRRGDWAKAGEWWRRQRQILEQMSGEAEQSRQ